MARTDTQLDAMLRHLGASYYEPLHGRATRLDVTLVWDIDGVVDVVNRLGQARPAKPAATA